MSSNLDKPLDPKGNAYTSLKGDGQFLYAIICDGKIHHTNSKKRWKRHYRAASKRHLSGTWFYWTQDVWGGPDYYTWWRIRLTNEDF
jgi:hypothetical protein